MILIHLKKKKREGREDEGDTTEKKGQVKEKVAEKDKDGDRGGELVREVVLHTTNRTEAAKAQQPATLLLTVKDNVILANDSLMRTTACSWRTVMGTMFPDSLSLADCRTDT